MSERCQIGWRSAVLGIGLAAIALGAASTASAAVVYEPTPPIIYEPAVPPFCTPVAVGEDPLAPLRRFPKLHAPPASGRVGFGPASLRLHPLPALVTDEGQVGYKLELGDRAPAIHPNWVVRTTLSRLDWQGRVVKVVDHVRRHLRTVKAKRGAGVQFGIKGLPAPYRVTTVFRSKSGRKLAKYGFYFRLVPTTSDVRLALNASSYRAGDWVVGRVENFGTLPVSYGAPYAIERFDGASWNRAPESPRVFTMPSFGAAPGWSGAGCAQFRVRPAMPIGRYRMSKEIDVETVPRLRADRATIYAEFDVLP